MESENTSNLFEIIYLKICNLINLIAMIEREREIKLSLSYYMDFILMKRTNYRHQILLTNISLPNKDVRREPCVLSDSFPLSLFLWIASSPSLAHSQID